MAGASVIAGCLIPAAALGGPWVDHQGDGYAKASFQRFTSRQYVDANNQVVQLDDARFEGDLYAVYAQVGLGGGFGVVAMVPFATVRNVYEDPTVVYGYRGIGDVELGVQYGRAIAGVPLSVSVIAKIPGYDNHDPRIAPGRAAAFPILGDGQVDVTALVAVGGGYALGRWRGWSLAEAGPRVRTAWYPFDSQPPALGFAEGLVWRVQSGLLPKLGSWEAGWLTVDAGGLQTFVKDGRSRSFVQVGGSVAARVYRGPGEHPAVRALHVEVAAAAVPTARYSGTGWMWSIGLSAQR